ncbi:DUF4174 domain-containing protein [Algoriphagus namhaensis]|uniref:DUF4174 domain-containing protein n=1 Tax=Algoriphagus namhaensis TaxID=915353 RepID=A0ABV8AW14_9BACT
MFSFSSDAKAPKDFRWENRILICYNWEESSKTQVEALGNGFEERRLLYFGFNGEEIRESNFSGEIDESSFLQLRKNESVKWILIGLDGGVKAFGEQKPEIEEVFKTIDSMPMRQSEIRKRVKDGRNR